MMLHPLILNQINSLKISYYQLIYNKMLTISLHRLKIILIKIQLSLILILIITFLILFFKGEHLKDNKNLLIKIWDYYNNKLEYKDQT